MSHRVVSCVFFAAAAASSACKLQQGDWGFGAIERMQTPPDPPVVACGMTLPPDALEDERAACAFKAGTKPAESLGVAPEVLTSLPIRHVLVVMRENRSYDHILGALEGIPSTFSNPDRNGNAIYPRPAITTCIPHDPGHQSRSMIESVNGGRMDGFVLNAARTTPTDGAYAMEVYDETQLPFYYWLARTFALADRHFASMQSGTFPNRNFMLFGTNAGVVDTGIVYPLPSTPSIMQLLMNAGYTWAVYTDGAPFSATLGWDAAYHGVRPLAQLYDDLDQGKLPSVAFVDGIENVDDDHPIADLQVGEAWLRKIYTHVVASPQWNRLAMVWTYDEAGGFFDHVPPEPPGCAAEPGSPWTERGPRIPFVMISPWARRGYVSHVPRDHTAITRFIEALFDLPALTPRDANADALLDLFDFSCSQDPSVPPAPQVGQGGCAGIGLIPE